MKPLPILALTLCFITVTHPGRAADPAKFDLPDPVAVVEGTEIKPPEVQKAAGEWLQRKGKKFATATDAEKMQAVRAVLDQLITRQLIKSRSAGVEVTDANLEAHFKQIVPQASDPKKFQQQLEAADLTEAQLKEQIRELMREQRWIADQLFGQGDATDAEAKDYYNAHLAEFDKPNLVHASHILVSVPTGAPPDVAAERLKIIEAAQTRIKKGEDFARVAEDVSEDVGSKGKGGDLGSFPISAKPAEVASTAFALKDGEVSKIVISELGFHIVKRIDHQDARKVPFEEAKSSILTYLTRKNQTALTDKLVGEIRSKADVKINLPPQVEAKGQTQQK